VVIFAYGISWDVTDIRTVIVDQDASSRSRSLVEAFRASGYFTMEEAAATSGIDGRIDRGRAQLALVIPPDFTADLGGGTPAHLQAIVDGSDANTATIILGYTQAVVEAWASDLMLSKGVTVAVRAVADPRVVQRGTGEPQHDRTGARRRDHDDHRRHAHIAHDRAGVGARHDGTARSTPVHRTEVVLGKLLPYLAIGVIDVVLASVLGVLLFDVPFRGSVALLMVSSTLFLIGALGLGMFISAATRSQLLATQLAMVVTFLPAFLLSGFMYSLDVMPRALQAVTYLIPARYFVVVTRGVFLKGVGVDVLYIQALMMIAFAGIGLLLSIHVFRKEIA
jgi:ABC-2 type transport system permease protein